MSVIFVKSENPPEIRAVHQPPMNSSNSHYCHQAMNRYGYLLPIGETDETTFAALIEGACHGFIDNETEALIRQLRMM